MAKPQCEFRRHIIGILMGCYLGFLGRSNKVCNGFVQELGISSQICKILVVLWGSSFFTDQSRKKGKSWDLILDILDFGVPKIQGY